MNVEVKGIKVKVDLDKVKNLLEDRDEKKELANVFSGEDFKL